MKKILFITYHYPPDPAIGAQRTAQFVKYLLDYDVDPWVLTIKPKYYNSLVQNDEQDDFMEKQVVRTILFPWTRDIYLKISRIFKKTQSDSVWRVNQPVRQEGDWKESDEGILKRIKRVVLSLFFWLPDDKLGWLIPGTFQAVRLIKNKKIDWIVTSGPPQSVHLIGLLVKRITNVRWVVDLRDPWVGRQKRQLVRSHISDNIEEWLEKKVINSSDSVVTTTKNTTELYRRRYQHCDSKHFVTICNGYDPIEINELKKQRKYEKLTFTYAGSLYLDRDPELFLEAFSILLAEGHFFPGNVQIKFVGQCRHTKEKSVEEMVIRFGLQEIMHFVDPVPRRQAMLETAKSHVMLLFAQNQPLQVPGKLYDYLGLGTFVLGICESKGASYSILREYENAIITNGQHLEHMKQSIIRLAGMVAKNSVGEGKSNVDSNKYDRRVLTYDLASIINN